MTVPREQMVRWWPLVDVTKIDPRPGDVVVLRSVERLSDPVAKRCRDEWAHAVPGTQAILLVGGLDLVAIQRAMPEMRAEDLYLPVRKSTMEP